MLNVINLLVEQVQNDIQQLKTKVEQKEMERKDSTFSNNLSVGETKVDRSEE